MNIITHFSTFNNFRHLHPSSVSGSANFVSSVGKKQHNKIQIFTFSTVCILLSLVLTQHYHATITDTRQILYVYCYMKLYSFILFFLLPSSIIIYRPNLELDFGDFGCMDCEVELMLATLSLPCRSTELLCWMRQAECMSKTL